MDRIIEIRTEPGSNGLEDCHLAIGSSGKEVGRIWTSFSGNIGWIKSLSLSDPSNRNGIEDSLIQFAKETLIEKGAVFFGMYSESEEGKIGNLKDQGWVEMGKMLTVVYPPAKPDEIPETVNKMTCSPLDKDWDSMDSEEQKWVEVFLESRRIQLDAKQIVNYAFSRADDTILLVYQKTKIVGVGYFRLDLSNQQAELFWVGKSVDLPFDTVTKLFRRYWANSVENSSIETVFHFNTFFLGMARKYCSPGEVVGSKTVMVNENFGTGPYISLLSGFHFS